MQGTLVTQKGFNVAGKAAVATVAASRGPVAPFTRHPAAAHATGKQVHATSVRPIGATAVAEPQAEAVDQVPARAEASRGINASALQLKFVVPNSVVGAVLGKGGATVAAIKAKTGCYVQLAKAGTAVPDYRERMLIIVGESVESLKTAVGLVLDAIVESGHTDKLRWLRRYPTRVFLQQVIPATCAGKVMGPEGEHIKGVGARTGCSVVVEAKPRNAAFVPFRMVNYLADEPAQLVAAVGEVLDTVVQDDKYAPGIQEISSICMRILPISQRKVGNLLGPGGMHIKALQEVLKVKIGVADAQPATSGVRYVTLWGPAQSMRVATDVVLLAAGTLPEEDPRRQQQGRGSGGRSGDADDASSVAGSVRSAATEAEIEA